VSQSIPHNQRAWQDDPEQPDRDYDESLSPDEAEQDAEHDRLYDAMYSGRTEISDNCDPETESQFDRYDDECDIYGGQYSEE